MRAKGGLHDHPDRQEFKNRLRTYILGKNEGVLSSEANVEEDDAPDLETNSSSLTGLIFSKIHPSPLHVEDEIDNLPQMDYDGLENLAGYICHRMKGDFPSIADNADSNYTWVTHVSEGGLTKPIESLVQHLRSCERIFKEINKEKLLISEHYLKMHLQQSVYVDFPEKVKKLFFRARMYFKIRKFNMEIIDLKRQQSRKRAKL